MAKITTKKDLINTAESQYQKLITSLSTMSNDDVRRPFIFNVDGKKEAHWQRDQDIRDVLIHLYEWQRLLLTWATANINGTTQPFLPEPYNWKTYGELNVLFWKKHQATSYQDALDFLQNSHHDVMIMIENLSDDDLFTKGYFKWTGGSTLGAYCVSTTASHYDWALKKIKMHIGSIK